MSIFGIAIQQAQLKKRSEYLVKKRKHIYIEPVKGIEKARQDVNQYCALLNTLTATRTGMLKSFIPGTAQFTVRRKCDIALTIFKGLLDKIETALKNGKPITPTPRIKKSISDEVIVREPVYKSPISQPYQKTHRTHSLRNYQPETLRLS